MSRIYQAVVHVETPRLSSRRFRNLDDRLSYHFWNVKGAEGAVVLASKQDRSIRVLIGIPAASKGAAEANLDRILKSVMYRLENEAGFARRVQKQKAKPAPVSLQPLERVLAFA